MRVLVNLLSDELRGRYLCNTWWKPISIVKCRCCTVTNISCRNYLSKMKFTHLQVVLIWLALHQRVCTSVDCQTSIRDGKTIGILRPTLMKLVLLHWYWHRFTQNQYPANLFLEPTSMCVLTLPCLSKDLYSSHVDILNKGSRINEGNKWYQIRR